MQTPTPKSPRPVRLTSLPARSALPPVWIMGLTNGCWGLMGGFAVVTVPEILAAHGVPGGAIAKIVATILLPGTLVAFISPMLDVRFSRRTYALVAALLTAAAVMFTVFHQAQPGLIEAVMFAGYMVAVGGWNGRAHLQGDRADEEQPIGLPLTTAGSGTERTRADTTFVSRR